MIQPVSLLWTAQLRLSLLCKGQEILGMPSAYDRKLAVESQAFQSVFANRLEHCVPRLARRIVHGPEQAFGKQRVDAVQRIDIQWSVCRRQYLAGGMCCFDA